MFKFKLRADTFLRLQRRLIGVAASDKDAVVTFTLEEAKLTVRYKSKLGKSETTSLFAETLTADSPENTGSASILIQELSAIKMEPLSSTDKFPFTEFIELHFQTSILKTHWTVQHSEAKSSKVNLAHAILENMPDVAEFDKLLEEKTNFIQLSGKDLQDTIAYCNMFKVDATSRDSNGCLLEVSGQKLVAVGTDSVVASKYEAPILSQHLKDPFRVVLDNSVLIFVRTFLNDIDLVKICATKRFLFIFTDSRSMCVPTMNVEYNIKDPQDFFKIDSPFIGTIDPTPVISILNTLTHLSNDVHSRVELQFQEGSFNVRTAKNSSDELPCDLVAEALIKVNSNLFLTSIKKLESYAKKHPVQLFFNTQNRRIMVSSENQELIFLIQGMRD